MVLRIPLRRSASFTPDHQPGAEVSTSTPVKMEANVVVLGADSVGKSGKLARKLLQGVCYSRLQKALSA